jgi:pyruvate formate lyase activating enzyme
MVSPVRSASTGAGYLRGAQAFAAFAASNQENSREDDPMSGQGPSYPRYAVSNGPEYGYKNLAVFYNACSFNCLYCQNYHFKEHTFSSRAFSAKELASRVDEKTTCICYFGGDPTPQILHAIKASKLALKQASGRILRIC